MIQTTTVTWPHWNSPNLGRLVTFYKLNIPFQKLVHMNFTPQIQKINIYPTKREKFGKSSSSSKSALKKTGYVSSFPAEIPHHLQKCLEKRDMLAPCRNTPKKRSFRFFTQTAEIAPQLPQPLRRYRSQDYRGTFHQQLQLQPQEVKRQCQDAVKGSRGLGFFFKKKTQRNVYPKLGGV